jgi:hypothetical protein
LPPQISGERKAEVSELADRIATFARSMTEIGAGIRMPDEAHGVSDGVGKRQQ